MPSTADGSGGAGNSSHLQLVPARGMVDGLWEEVFKGNGTLEIKGGLFCFPTTPSRKCGHARSLTDKMSATLLVVRHTFDGLFQPNALTKQPSMVQQSNFWSQNK